MRSCIVFVGGGTGGHIYPGLAIIAEMQKQKVDMSVFWFGSSVGMDASIVENAHIPFIGIPSGKLRRYMSFKNVTDVFKLCAGFFVSCYHLLRLKPQFVFSKGGFVSVPPCMAARVLGIPVYTHECDFSPGLATKINTHFATDVFVSYEETKRFFSPGVQKKLRVTGNPIRSDFYTAQAYKGRSFLGLSENGNDELKALPILLIIGGSLGARQINSFVCDRLDWLCERFIVVHQTGEKNIDQVCNHAHYKPYPYIRNEMADVLACADIVLARSGANSLWECAALGKALILVPLCGTGTRGDQVENARYFEERGAAISFTNAQTLSTDICAALDGLLREPDCLVSMRCASADLGKNRATEYIASLLIERIQ